MKEYLGEIESNKSSSKEQVVTVIKLIYCLSVTAGFMFALKIKYFCDSC